MKKNKLANFRRTETIEISINGYQTSVGFSEYDDGSLGEVFIYSRKQGSELQTLLECFAISISLNLQYGVEPERLVKLFKNTQFKPHGKIIGYEGLDEVQSIIDFIFIHIENHYSKSKKVSLKAA